MKTKPKPKGGRPPHKAPATAAELRRMTRAQVLRTLRVPPATFDAWRRAGLPEDRGRFDVAAIVGWLRDRWHEERAATTAEPSAELERWRRARADSAELARDEARCRLVPRADVIDFANRASLTAKNRLLAMVKKCASRLGPLIPGADGFTIVERELHAEAVAVCLAFARGGMDRLPGADGAASAALADAGLRATPPTTPPAPLAATTEPLGASPGTEPDGDEDPNDTHEETTGA